MSDKLDEEVTAALDATPALAPYLPELLADLSELGSSADTICELIEPLGLNAEATRVLDLGCGKGTNAIALAKRFGYRALGVDGFPPFIAEAQRAAERAGVSRLCEFRHGDMRDALNTNPPYDILVLAAVGRVLGDVRETARQLRRAVRPGGYIVIDDCYLAEGHAIDKSNYEGYANRAETIAAMEAFGDKVLEEDASTPEEVRAENIENTRLIRARAEALAKKHPHDAALLMEFVAEQEKECEILENDLVCATWLIRRGAD